MAILRPQLAILDETDSGLDIDALKIVADGVNALRGPDFSALVITHYQRLLDHIVPDRVHVLAGGRIVRSGGPELAHELEAERLRRRWSRRPRERDRADRRCRVSWRATRRCAIACPAIPRCAPPPPTRSAARACQAHAGGARRRGNTPACARRRRRIPATAVAAGISACWPAAAIDAPRLVFVDGRFRAELSAPPPRWLRPLRRAARLRHAGAAGPRAAGGAEHDAGRGRRGAVASPAASTPALLLLVSLGDRSRRVASIRATRSASAPARG